MKQFLTAIPLLVVGLVGAHQAEASIITSLVSKTNSTFTYRADLTADQQIDATNQAFGTVYDFGTIIGSISSTGLLNSGFTFTTALTNTAAFQTGPIDDPNSLNIRFTANAGTTIGANTALGTFTVTSPFSFARLASFDGQASKFAPGTGANDTPTGNVGLVSVPSAVPEPTTMLSLGAGLLGVGFFSFKRRKV